eukprot:TRINITY_DN49608_c0_g1_i1.p1 TRINITY_DN49608_c0_g1~~TRINITY_DN49608_c0_g1_i1.p1  ORF type:complete len:562 (-),score=80.28 TRINITY_DN49608_c0_g1_i1:146-1831(-)
MGAFMCCATRDSVRSKKRIARMCEFHYAVPRPMIDHVVVLMLENRTFDNVFGVFMDRRYASKEIEPSRWDVRAKEGKRLYDYYNVCKRKDGKNFTMPVWSRDPEDEDIMSEEALGVPNGDPAEKFVLLNRCLFNCDDPDQGTVPTLGGFAQEYYNLEIHDRDMLHEAWVDETDFNKLRSPAMHVFLPEQMQIFTELATAFGLSDTYHSSAPCQTWPNRLFMHCGHCYGYVNNLADNSEPYDKEPTITPGTTERMTQFSDPTIFSVLLNHDVEWAIYHGDWALSTLLHLELHGQMGYMRSFDYCANFSSHVEMGNIAPFTWVEPQYLQQGSSPPNDMHPPHNTLYAQQLVADIYNSLRSNEETWKKTVFFVNTDEGVGIFDHVPPPDAPDPVKGYEKPLLGFVQQDDPRLMRWNPFTRYGTRVPCLIATPFLDPRSVVRPPETSEYPFDHCSIVRTVFDLFVGPDVKLTNRDKLAPSFVPHFRETAREDLGPKEIKLNVTPPPLCPSRELAGDARGPRQCHNVQALRAGGGGDADCPRRQSVVEGMQAKRGVAQDSHLKTYQ